MNRQPVTLRLQKEKVPLLKLHVLPLPNIKDHLFNVAEQGNQQFLQNVSTQYVRYTEPKISIYSW